MPRVPSRSHSRLPGPWDTRGVRPSCCNVRDGPLVTLQQLNVFFTAHKDTHDTPGSVSPSRLCNTSCAGDTPPAQDQAGRGRRRGNAGIGTKVGVGAQALTPTPEKAKPQREPQDFRETQHSRTSTSPASLAKLQKVASLHVQTVKVRAPFWPFRADRNWGALASSRQTGWLQVTSSQGAGTQGTPERTMTLH